MQKLKKGVYRHYKGNEYLLLMEAKDSSSQESMVVYQDYQDETKIWTRSKKEFLSDVEIDGETKPRFEFIGEENNSWEAKYRRALADYQNLLKQSAKEKQEFAKYALDDFLQNILPVFDHLKLALASLPLEDKKNPWVEGIAHVVKSFRELLSSYGVSEIKTVGNKFDHETMEALGGTGDKIKQEISPGYKLHDKLIRPAKVIVE